MGVTVTQEPHGLEQAFASTSFFHTATWEQNSGCEHAIHALRDASPSLLLILEVCQSSDVFLRTLMPFLPTRALGLRWRGGGTPTFPIQSVAPCSPALAVRTLVLDVSNGSGGAGMLPCLDVWFPNLENITVHLSSHGAPLTDSILSGCLACGALHTMVLHTEHLWCGWLDRLRVGDSLRRLSVREINDGATIVPWSGSMRANVPSVRMVRIPRAEPPVIMVAHRLLETM